MNKFKFFIPIIILLVLTLSFSSCTKEHEISDENQNVGNIDLALNGSINSLIDLGSNYASFRSEEDYVQFLKLLPSISDDEKGQLLSQANFTTFENYLDSLYEQMDLIDDRVAFIDFIYQHSDVFEIIIDDSGEEEVIEKEVSLDPSAIINNIDRIFKVGDIFYKHISDICIKSGDYNLLKKIKSKDDAINSRLDYEVAYNILGYDSSLRWTDLNKVFSLQAENNRPFCKNDRRVKLTWAIIEDVFTTEIPRPDGGKDKIKNNRVFVITEIHPTRKGIPCIWYNYKTLITSNNFNFAGNVRVTNSAISTSFNLTRPNTQVEARGLDTQDLVLTYFPIGDQKTEACWTRERTDVTTRGMDGFWINLNTTSICN